jgi:hypothetical protein
MLMEVMECVLFDTVVAKITKHAVKTFDVQIIFFFCKHFGLD